jgi:hypothetical protein
MIYTDQYRIVSKLIVPWLSKINWKTSLIWVNHAGHRAIFYHLLSIFNTEYLSYNTLLDSYLSVAALSLMLYLLISSIEGDTDQKSPASTVAHLLKAAVISSFVFASICTELFSWSLGVAIFAKNTAIVASALLIERNLRRSKSSALDTLMCLGMFMATALFFCGGYMYAYVCAVSLVSLAYILTGKTNNQRIFAFSLLASGGIAVSLYTRGLADTTSHSISFNVVLLFKFVAVGFANALLYNRLPPSSWEYLALGSVLLIGMVATFCKAVARVDMYLMPMILLCYSCVCMASVGIARLGSGITYALEARYLPETALGLIAAWVILVRSEFDLSSRLGTVAKCVATVLVLANCIGCIAEWKIGPYRKMYMNQLVEKGYKYLFDPNELSDVDFQAFNGQSTLEVKQALSEAVEFRLSAFSFLKRFGDKIYCSGNWYTDEGDGVWLKDIGSISYASHPTEESALRLSAPAEADRSVTVWSRDRELFSGNIPRGATITIVVPPGMFGWSHVSIRALNPAKVVGSNDLRILGVKVAMSDRRKRVEVYPKRQDGVFSFNVGDLGEEVDRL